MKVGQILKMERKKKGYSQEYVSLVAGYSRSFVSHVEAGRRDPCAFSLSVLLDVLAVPDSSSIVEAFIKEQMGRAEAC